jgi:hypothetical protein
LDDGKHPEARKTHEEKRAVLHAFREICMN